LYSAIAEHHGEPILTSKILEALLMPYPDKNTISALTESHLLNVGSVHDILRLALDCDLVLEIACTGLTVIATSPFHSEMFEVPFYSKKWYFILECDSDTKSDILISCDPTSYPEKNPVLTMYKRVD
jgi:hypothetical protein